MATIGTFTRDAPGTYTGTIKTLTLNAKTAIKPANKASDKAPDYRVFQGSVEFGAGWRKTSGEGRDYLSVKLDDSQLPGSDLRHPGRSRRARQLRPDLVPPKRRLTRVPSRIR